SLFSLFSFFFLLLPRPSTSTLFPYTTLFRSLCPQQLLIFDELAQRSGKISHFDGNADLGFACLDDFGNSPPTLEVAFRHQRIDRSEEHTSELQSQSNLVCRLLLEKKKTKNK